MSVGETLVDGVSEGAALIEGDTLGLFVVVGASLVDGAVVVVGASLSNKAIFAKGNLVGTSLVVITFSEGY
jgi:hypothetical protein